MTDAVGSDPRPSRWGDLGLDPQSRRDGRALVLTAVGAGGKTSLLHALAAEAANRGLRVAITTTTHMHCEPGMATTLEQALTRLGADSCAPVVAGRPVVAQGGQPRKFAGFGEQAVAVLAQVADVVLIEGDGSRRMPFKVPAAHEPVVPPETDHLVVVAGLVALDRPLREVCFRHEEAPTLVPDADAETDAETVLTPALAARLLTAGYLDRPCLASWRGRRTVVLTHADNPTQRRLGEQVASHLTDAPVVLAGRTTPKER